MNRVATFLFPVVAAVALVLTIFGFAVSTDVAFADDCCCCGYYGPCEDSPCSIAPICGNATCLGNLNNCEGCALDFDPITGFYVCACDSKYANSPPPSC